MIKILVLIACLAGAAHGGWTGQHMMVKWGLTGAFFSMPVYKDNATSESWVQQTPCSSPKAYSSLEMYCPADDFTCCIGYDDTGYIAFLQIAINQQDVSDPAFDWEDQGFSKWTAAFSNGTSITYWTMQVALASADDLATSSETRLANRDSNKLPQFDNIWVTGFDGNLYNISTNTDYVTGSSSIYTKQACIPWMGHHYYYNMSSSTECTTKKIFSWFPLVYSNQLVGVGFMNFHKTMTGNKYFEAPSTTAVKAIVTDGPDCLYDLSDSPGAHTLHIYFVKPASTITCIME